LATVVATAVVGASERGVWTVGFGAAAVTGAAAAAAALLAACPPEDDRLRLVDPVLGVAADRSDDVERTAGAGLGAGAGGEACGLVAGDVGGGCCTRTVAGDVAGGGGGNVFGGAVVTTGQGTGFQLASTQLSACAAPPTSGMATRTPDAPSSNNPDRILRSTALLPIGYRRTSALVGYRFHSMCANGSLAMVPPREGHSPNFFQIRHPDGEGGHRARFGPLPFTM
jgi:hypothetical protein